VGTLQGAQAVLRNPVVVMRAGLHDVVAQLAVGPVQNMPVAQDVGRAVHLVEDDAAEGAGRDLHVSDARTGQDRVEAPLARRALRLGHRHHAKQWFTRRLQAETEPVLGPDGVSRIGATADPDTLAIRMLGTVKSAIREGLAITRAEVKGRLTVTDPAALATTLTDGIGRARAYSCGLLLIR
jgi:hypothetical protein